MKIETLSVFPEMFDSIMGMSIMKRAQNKGFLDFKAYDLRDWTHDVHRTTDDAPYGGGPGLLMKPEPVFEAMDSLYGRVASIDTALTNAAPASDAPAGDAVADFASSDVPASDVPADFAPADTATFPAAKIAHTARPYVIFPTPTGEPFSQRIAEELSQKDHLLFICGHYEGFDERVYTLADRQISLGDFVLTGGEIAALVIIDAIVRLIPGVLGDDQSSINESFSAEGLLEYPQYTRPASYRGMDVPQVLLSGDHGKVDEWRRKRSIERTAKLRPDLLEKADLSDEERQWVTELQRKWSMI